MHSHNDYVFMGKLMANMRMDSLKNLLDSVEKFVTVDMEMLEGLLGYEESMIERVNELNGPASLGPVRDLLNIRILHTVRRLYPSGQLLCWGFPRLLRTTGSRWDTDNILLFISCK